MLDLFSGIGGTIHALQAAGLPSDAPLVCVSFESDPSCRDLLRHLHAGRHRVSDVKDSTGLAGSVLALVDDSAAKLAHILSAFPNLRSVPRPLSS